MEQQREPIFYPDNPIPYVFSREGYMEISAETAVCICQHIKAHFRQCADNEMADWGEPCADCKYALETCKLDWLTHLKPLFKETGVTIRLGKVGRSDK